MAPWRSSRTKAGACSFCDEVGGTRVGADHIHRRMQVTAAGASIPARGRLHMNRTSERRITGKRSPLQFLLLIVACVSFTRGGASSAVAAARRNVCGEPGGVTDAQCTTLGYTRVSGGYRILIA